MAESLTTTRVFPAKPSPPPPPPLPPPPLPTGAGSESPVPSITLQITKEDADRFLEASRALAHSVALERDAFAPAATTKTPSADAAAGNSPFSKTTPRLDELFYTAALASHDDALNALMHRLKFSGLALHERKAALLLLNETEMKEKLVDYFAVLSCTAGNNNNSKDDDNTAASSLHRPGLVSLFRSVLGAITASCGTEQASSKKVIVEGKPEQQQRQERSPEEPPTKKIKREPEEEATVSTTQLSPDNATSNSAGGSPKDDLRNCCQSPSFDSSLATLHDEDYAEGVRKEISEVAEYAAEQLVKYANRNKSSKKRTDDNDKVTAETFLTWYHASGNQIVPWLELLGISKWRTGAGPPPPSSSSPSPPPPPPPQAQDKTSNDDTISAMSTTVDSTPPPSTNGEENMAADNVRTLVSFDFSGSGHPTPLCINISEDNLFALRHFCYRTGLMHCQASDICKRLLRLATRRVFGDEAWLTLRRQAWIQSTELLVGQHVWSALSSAERRSFGDLLTEIFACFEGSKSFLRSDEVDLQEFAVGFCFFCAGNKSTKLATGFEMLDDRRKNHLSEQELLRYLNSYLTMLVAMSLLAPLGKKSPSTSFPALSHEHRREMRAAVEAGARWTLGHFLRHLGDADAEARQDQYTFEKFAAWYSTGGYEVAPWLELLDLNKVFSLIPQTTPHSPALDLIAATTTERKRIYRDRVSSLRRHHTSRAGPPPEILFTFPLANHRSLVVLKEDATYVRGVVEQLGLLSMNPDDLWTAVSLAVKKKQKTNGRGQGGAIYVDTDTFVHCMQGVCPKLKRKRSEPGDADQANEVLSNFFQCFDLEETDSVALDELMGGLTLLCGGKKSHKLAFAFGVFDTRPGIHEKKHKESIAHSLSGQDLFLFLRSILIVTFSCCRQSLDMSDNTVGRCIADTANMICNDVMRHQWDLRQKDRLNFDEFGQWYNDGGFERAPWLELLDLKKWVLVDNFEALSKQPPRGSTAEPILSMKPIPAPSESDVPPPPPEDSLDPDFFENSIMPMDSMDEMDMILMQPSTDKETDILSPRSKQSYSLSPGQSPPDQLPPPLKFHLNTDEEHGGYVLAFSHQRIRRLREILEASSLHELEAEVVCNQILAKATKSKTPKLTKDSFDSVIVSMLQDNVNRTLSDVLSGVFSGFDRERSGKVSAIEVACGFTVLCKGKKSDKLEFAFEVLDKRKRGHLSMIDMTNYLKSFLTVLLSIAFAPGLDDDPRGDTLTTLKGEPCDSSSRTIMNVVDAGAKWAASIAFDGFRPKGGQGRESSMSFDDFAHWYTNAGYSSIPWLELLDLRKWVFTNDTS